MIQYLALVRDILENGIETHDRTGTGTIRVIGRQLRYDISNNTLPILTTKEINVDAVVAELLWMISGSVNVNDLHGIGPGTKIWDAWADETGSLGPIYGKQWRDWNGVDQLRGLVESIRTNPHDRRHVLNAWNVDQLYLMALPPCHLMSMYSVIEDRLCVHLVMRSNDIGLGHPFNIIQYSILAHMIAKETGLKATELIVSLNDAHIYSDHVEQLKIQLQRVPYDKKFTLELSENKDMFFKAYSFDDVNIVGYDSESHYGKLPMKISV